MATTSIVVIVSAIAIRVVTVLVAMRVALAWSVVVSTLICVALIPIFANEEHWLIAHIVLAAVLAPVSAFVITNNDILWAQSISSAVADNNDRL